MGIGQPENASLERNFEVMPLSKWRISSWLCWFPLDSQVTDVEMWVFSSQKSDGFLWNHLSNNFDPQNSTDLSWFIAFGKGNIVLDHGSYGSYPPSVYKKGGPQRAVPSPLLSGVFLEVV